MMPDLVDACEKSKNANATVSNAIHNWNNITLSLTLLTPIKQRFRESSKQLTLC